MCTFSKEIIKSDIIAQPCLVVIATNVHMASNMCLFTIVTSACVRLFTLICFSQVMKTLHSTFAPHFIEVSTKEKSFVGMARRRP